MSQKSPPESYGLGRDYAASSRLNCQFYLWKETLEFNLHPSIPVPGPEEKLCIAEVATGTGIWLVDVARSFPTAQLDGFDISLAQCPPKQWLPENINFRAWNMFEDVPEDLRGKYDIVHIRLVSVVIQGDDPLPVIRNLLKMLKPNGYLQWDEVNFAGTYIASIDPSVKSTALEKYRQTQIHRQNWVLHLPETLMKEGFSEASLYHYQDHSSELKAHFDLILTTVEELMTTTAKGTAQGEEILRSIADIYGESKSGAVLGFPRVVCVAKKSS